MIIHGILQPRSAIHSLPLTCATIHGLHQRYTTIRSRAGPSPYAYDYPRASTDVRDHPRASPAAGNHPQASADEHPQLHTTIDRVPTMCETIHRLPLTCATITDVCDHPW